MKLQFNNETFDIQKPDALDYIKSVFLSTIESRQGKKDDPEREARVVELLRNLESGILPQRGSKGSTREPWESERTVILKSMLQSAGIEHSLKGDDNVNAAIEKLANAQKRDAEEFAQMLDKRAQERYQLLNAPL